MPDLAPIVSHGRGGQGNIGRSSQEYVDGEIVRQGDPAASGGAYSTGRGGGGNINTASKPADTSNDKDVVPEQAKVPLHEGEVYHSGRGGEGNAFVAGADGKKKDKVAHQGLADKIKAFIKKFLKKDKAKAPATTDTTTPAPAPATAAA